MEAYNSISLRSSVYSIHGCLLEYVAALCLHFHTCVFRTPTSSQQSELEGERAVLERGIYHRQGSSRQQAI